MVISWRWLRHGALALALLTAGCGEEGSGPAPAPAPGRGNGQLVVYVVNYPLRFFAERIGGDAVRVEFPAPPDVDPAFWSPDAETVVAYQGADLILLNGARYARWVERVTLPPSRLVDTSKASRDRYLTIRDAAVHSHGPGGEHSHGTLAFTTWLDPTLAIEQARAILEAFTSARPRRGSTFQSNFDSLRQDLLDLDRTLAELTGGGRKVPLLASHPVYQYLAQRYGLDLRSVHFEPEVTPNEQGWKELEELRAAGGAQWMLWEKEPLAGTAERLRGLGVESIVFDPCGNTPFQEDFLSVMGSNAASLEVIYSR